jgi:hypothetical protein
MIGQYLLNNNEKRYSVILPNFSDLNRPLVCLHLNARSPCAAVIACHDGVSASSIRHGLISIPIPFRPSGPCRRAVFVVPIEQRTIATGLDA